MAEFKYLRRVRGATRRQNEDWEIYEQVEG